MTHVEDLIKRLEVTADKLETARAKKTQDKVVTTSGSTPSFTAADKQTTKPTPRKVLEGNKWLIEHFDSPGDVVTVEVEMTQTVYVYKCKNMTISIKGKVNVVTLDACQKVDKSQDVQLFLSAQCLGGATQIFSSQSGGMNVLFNKPPSTGSGMEQSEPEMEERNIPEQFCTTVDHQGKLVTRPAQHSSSG